MLKKIRRIFHSDRPRTQTRSDRSLRSCKAFHKLKEWQVSQYRSAVDENKWYMTERLGRQVAWEEAEEDFLHNEYYGCAPKWRKQFCADRCPHYTACDLGRQFCPEE